MLNRHPGNDCGILHTGMDLQMGASTCSLQGQLWSQTWLCRVYSPQRMAGWSLGSLSGQPAPLLSHPLGCMRNWERLFWTDTVLLRQQSSVSGANSSPMSIETARGALGCFQNRGNEIEHNQKPFLGWGEGKALQIHGWNQLINLNWRGMVLTL